MSKYVFVTVKIYTEDHEPKLVTTLVKNSRVKLKYAGKYNAPVSKYYFYNFDKENPEKIKGITVARWDGTYKNAKGKKKKVKKGNYRAVITMKDCINTKAKEKHSVVIVKE